MKNVLENSMEAELEELFVNCQRGDTLRISLEEMSHQKPPTPVVTDSPTSNIFMNDNIQKRKSRAIDMRLYWVRGRVK